MFELIISDFVSRLAKVSMRKVSVDANASQDISPEKYMRYFIKSKYLQDNILKYI